MLHQGAVLASQHQGRRKQPAICPASRVHDWRNGRATAQRRMARAWLGRLPVNSRQHRLSARRCWSLQSAQWWRTVADASGQELIQRLTQRMLRKKLYVILSKGG